MSEMGKNIKNLQEMSAGILDDQRSDLAVNDLQIHQPKRKKYKGMGENGRRKEGEKRTWGTLRLCGGLFCLASWVLLWCYDSGTVFLCGPTSVTKTCYLP